jgi:hypothetical protein
MTGPESGATNFDDTYVTGVTHIDMCLLYVYLMSEVSILAQSS